jgi:pimeloyl-ACP methyl ester carboxylesterase
MPPVTDPPDGSSQVVVLVHGIRTQAAWAEMVKHALEDEPTVQKVIPIRYGYFNLFRFLTPVFTRHGPIQLLARELRDIRKQYPNARLSLIAHSFGTYAAAKVLENETDIAFDRLVFCGSIVPQDFRWDKVADRVRHEILNDCGTRDLWPVLARFMTWGFGPSGTYGFGKNRVRDRFHNYRHSDFFNREFVEQFWSPYIASGTIVHSEWELNRPKPPWWHSALGVVKLPVLIAFLLAGTVGWRSVRESVIDRNLRVVCIAPHPKLWEMLPPFEGVVASPVAMRITAGDRFVAVDTLFQRIYCLGEDREAIVRLVARVPEGERYEALRAYLATLTDDPGTIDLLIQRYAGVTPAYVETPGLEPGATLRVEVERTAQPELPVLSRLETTVADDRRYTLEILKPVE